MYSRFPQKKKKEKKKEKEKKMYNRFYAFYME